MQIGDPPLFRTFIYGSLRKGEYNHERFSELSECFRGEGFIRGALLKNLGSYPAVVPSPDLSHTVKGEIYDVPEALHRRLYNMEIGAGYIYLPVQVHVEANAEEQAGKTVPIEASVYVYRDPNQIEKKPTVEGGDWCKRNLRLVPKSASARIQA